MLGRLRQLLTLKCGYGHPFGAQSGLMTLVNPSFFGLMFLVIHTGGPGDGRRRRAVGRVPPALAWGVDTAARLEAAIQALGGRRRPRPATPYMPLGQRDRRAAVLRFCGRG